MLGQIIYSTKGGRGEQVSLHGLPVLRVPIDPDSFWIGLQLRRAGKQLYDAGVRRILTPPDFDRWEPLSRYELRPVDPGEFLRSHAAPISLASLRRSGRSPQRCAVAVRGIRADRAAILAAEELCAQVREVCISIPQGGERLKDHLRWEYGLAVRPDWSGVEGAVRFARQTDSSGSCVVELFPGGRGTGEVKIFHPGLDQAENGQIALLAALWEGGKVGRGELEFA